MKGIFLTGATGFLGSNLLKLLVQDKDTKVYVLIRSKKGKGALARKNDVLKRIFKSSELNGFSNRIELIDGDLLGKNLGISKRKYEKLSKEIDVIYHVAAAREFSWKIEPLRKSNVEGTRYVLKFALLAKKTGRLKKVNYVSTAFIAGDYPKVFRENYLDKGQAFNNAYERSKFEAEKLVNEYRKTLDIDIFRPSIVTDTINIYDRNAPLYFRLVSILATGLFAEIPADRRKKVNLITVDSAAKVIYLISKDPHGKNKNYHIVNPKPISFGMVVDVTSSVLGFKKPKCVSIKKFNQGKMNRQKKRLLKYIIPYLKQNVHFDMSNTMRVLDKYGYKIPPITKRLMRRVIALKTNEEKI